MKQLLNGNVRLFGQPPSWQGSYADTLEGRTIVGETALGLQFAADADGTIAVLDPEGRSLQDTGCDLGEFLAAVLEDPDDLVDQKLFEACVARFGQLTPDRHFAFIREIVLGGERSADNIEVLDAAEHMAALASMSRQIASAKPGTRIRDVR